MKRIISFDTSSVPTGTISARYIDVAFANTWGRPKTFHIIHNSTSGDVNPGGTSLGIGTNSYTTHATGTDIQNTNMIFLKQLKNQ